MRPKRLTTLQAITHSLETSIEKAKRSKDYSSVDRKEGYILKKEIKNPYVKSFNVRKLKEPDPHPQDRKVRFKSLRMHTEKVLSPARS
jgi:hypothetical protein